MGISRCRLSVRVGLEVTSVAAIEDSKHNCQKKECFITKSSCEIAHEMSDIGRRQAMANV